MLSGITGYLNTLGAAKELKVDTPTITLWCNKGRKVAGQRIRLRCR